MALSPDFRISAVAADGSYSILTDYTVYGAPNQLRNAVAVAMTSYKVDEDLVETAQTVASYNPETATYFTITNDLDGWVKYYCTIINYWLIGTTYNLNDVVWDSTLNAYYQYIFATPSSGHAVTDSTYWVIVTDPTALIADVGTSDEVGNMSYQVVNVILRYKAEKCYSSLATLVAKEACTDACAPISTLNNAFIRIDGLLNASIIDEIQQLYLAGERAMRLAERYCDDCGCGCNSN